MKLGPRAPQGVGRYKVICKQRVCTLHDLSSATQTQRQAAWQQSSLQPDLVTGTRARKSALSILGSFLLPVSRCCIIQPCRYCVDIAHYTTEPSQSWGTGLNRTGLVSELRAREFIAACVLDYIIWWHFYMTQCRAGGRGRLSDGDLCWSWAWSGHCEEAASHSTQGDAGTPVSPAHYNKQTSVNVYSPVGCK